MILRLGYSAALITPPSARTAAQLIAAASGEQTKTTTFATSSGSRKRLSNDVGRTLLKNSFSNSAGVVSFSLANSTTKRSEKPPEPRRTLRSHRKQKPGSLPRSPRAYSAPPKGNGRIASDKLCLQAAQKDLRDNVRSFGYSCSWCVFVKRARGRITSTIAANIADLVFKAFALSFVEGPCYAGSLAARTSTFSITGGCANNSEAFAFSAAATRPAR